jgi:hypothetical protein
VYSLVRVVLVKRRHDDNSVYRLQSVVYPTRHSCLYLIILNHYYCVTSAVRAGRITLVVVVVVVVAAAAAANERAITINRILFCPNSTVCHASLCMCVHSIVYCTI